MRSSDTASEPIENRPVVWANGSLGIFPQIAERLLRSDVRSIGSSEIVNNALFGSQCSQEPSASSTGSPSAFHSGNPSSNLRTLKPRALRAATASYDKTQYSPRQ